MAKIPLVPERPYKSTTPVSRYLYFLSATSTMERRFPRVVFFEPVGVVMAQEVRERQRQIDANRKIHDPDIIIRPRN